MTWLNWSLKLHFGLRTIPHLILTHNTQVLVQLMLISFVWLYMFKCDVYAQLLADQIQKDFWVFYMFLKAILYFRAISFCSKWIFVSFFKNLFRGIFTRSSWLRASREKSLRETKNLKIHIESFATVLRLFLNQKLLVKVFVLQWCFSWVISWLSNPRKTHVFSFIGLMWQIFKTLSISLSLPHLNRSQPKSVFHSNPIFFKLNLYSINSEVCFS